MATEKRTRVRVNELPERPEPGVMLRCDRCGETNSATRGDYFMATGSDAFRHCRRFMRLVRRVVTYEAVVAA